MELDSVTCELNSLSSIHNGSRVFGIHSNELYIGNSSFKDNAANGGCGGAIYLENNNSYFQMISKSLIVAYFVEMSHFLAMVDLYLYETLFQMTMVFGHCLPTSVPTTASIITPSAAPTSVPSSFPTITPLRAQQKVLQQH